MTLRHFPTAALATGFACVLAACGSGQSPSSSAPASATTVSNSPIGKAIDQAVDKANQKLAKKNITISNDEFGVPKAEITPKGNFLIEGQQTPLTSAQRAEMRTYRGQLIGIERAGIAIGKQGAALGIHAASEAIQGVLSGKSDQQIRSRVEAEATGIRHAAGKICDQLPALMASQQQLAADVPAFKPYADLTPAKIDQCRQDARKHD